MASCSAEIDALFKLQIGDCKWVLEKFEMSKSGGFSACLCPVTRVPQTGNLCRMKIVQLVTQTVLGGAETYGYALGCQLAARGHDVHVLANRLNGPLFERPRPDNLQVDALVRESRLDPRILSFLVGHLRRIRPDVLHAHNFGANTWARALGYFFPDMAVVCHVHAGRMVTSQPAHRAFIDRTLFRRADLVIGLNQEMMDYLRGRLAVPESRSMFLANGIDMDRFSPPQAPRGAGEVVCVASLTDVKNHKTLLDAWKIVVDRVGGAPGSAPGTGPGTGPGSDSTPGEGVNGLRLTLVGDGVLRPELEAQVASLGIADTVEFAGLQADVLPFFQRASVFVLPSLREALPLSLLEAMATGGVPVASNVGGIPEVVDEGRTGFLVEPGDAETLAARIHDLVTQPDRTREMASAARESVAGTYGLSAIVDQLEKQYEAALARRRGR